MRQALIAGLLLFCAATTFAQDAGRPRRVTGSTTPISHAHVLTRVELDKLLAAPKDLLIIDVRRPDEVSSIGGLPVYLSVQLGDLQKSLEWIPKGRTIVTVSNHARRAGVAADLLASKGFKVAGAAGVQTYEQEGGKLTKVVIPPPPAAAATGAPPAGAGKVSP